MRCLNCGICCTKTEMLLSIADIQRLERAGYNRRFFVRFDKAGYAKLRNRRGHCVFHDPRKSRCKVYSNRPQGCRVFPVIHDETKGIMIDEICPAQGTLAPQEKAEKGLKVLKLLNKIDTEVRNTNHF